MVFSVESGKRGASRSGRSEPPKKEIGPQGVEPLAVSRCVPLYTARFVPNRKKPDRTARRRTARRLSVRTFIHSKIRAKPKKTGEGRRKNRRRTSEGRPDRPTRAAGDPQVPKEPRGTARQRAPQIALIMPAFGRSRTISVQNGAPVLCMLGARAVRAGTSVGAVGVYPTSFSGRTRTRASSGGLRRRRRTKVGRTVVRTRESGASSPSAKDRRTVLGG